MKTALVTGASRGVGKGVAIALADAGWNVFATGRSILAADLPPAIHRLPCDHLSDEQTAAAFQRIATESAPLDLLVQSALLAQQERKAPRVMMDQLEPQECKESKGFLET